MYLIDTDVLIWVLRGNDASGLLLGNEKYLKFLQKLKDKEPLSISTITIAEIYKNIFPEEIIKTENLLQEFQIWDVTTSIAKQAGLYWQQYSPKLKNLNITDCLIAASANMSNSTLVSLNIKHFPMKDIKVLNPGD